MSNLTVGQLVRISSDLIPETAKSDQLFGDLGTPGLFRFATFEIVSIQKDESRGDIAICKITNPEVFKTAIPGVKEVRYEGEAVLLIKDLVPANSKISLEYIIQTSKTKDEMIVELFEQRQAFRDRGMDKRNKEMRDNWKQIQVLRGEIMGPMPALGTIVAILPKQRTKFVLQPDEMPGTDEESRKRFERLLTSKLRNERILRRRPKIENKTVFGMINVQKQGGVFLKEGSLLKAYEEMMITTLEVDKKPVDPKATYIGVEVEFIYSGQYDTLKKLLIQNKLHRHVCLKDDGSVHACHNNRGYTGKELTLICKNTEVENVLQRLDQVLAHPAIDGFANRSCGLHVHLDMRNRDPKLVYKNMVRIQNILRGSQPVGRIKNHHCKANTSDRLDDLLDNGGGRDNRYWVINGTSFEKHKSIEIRIHEGTTDCEAIYNWVSLLDAVASYTKEIPAKDYKLAEDLVDACADMEIPLNAIDYVDRRIERFKSLSQVV